MKPDPARTTLLGENHCIEIGSSSWDEQVTSIRNRYDKNGKFNPHASSEIPLEDIEHLLRAATGYDLLDSAYCARRISMLASSIERRVR